MKIVLVNATALVEGGGLTILKQFLDNIEINENKYIVFTSLLSLKEEYKEKINIVFVFPKAKKLFDRYIWDNFGLKNWLKENNIKPDLLISLQNTGVNIDKEVYQILYLHQAIPFVDKKWNVLKKSERKFWFYKNIYKYFINQHLDKTDKVIVQAHWLRPKFADKFNYPIEKIEVFTPEFNLDFKNIKVNNRIIVDNTKFNIFYPASPFIYKNHIAIINALSYLKSNNYDISNFRVYFTFKKEDNLQLWKIIKDNSLESNFVLLGKLEYDQVVAFYNDIDLLVFPSYLETFGLPLIEAANFGKAIVAADEDFSKEVLKGYKGVVFVKSNNNNEWAKEIFNVYSNKFEYNSFKYRNKNSWKEFFEMINNIIKGR